MKSRFTQNSMSMALAISVALAAQLGAQGAAPVQDIRGLRGELEIPEPAPWLMLSIASLGVLGLVGAGGWWLALRRQPELLPSPWDTALGELEQARELMTPEQASSFAYAVSHIVREYIQRRFLVAAPRCTTEEFLDIVRMDHAGLLAEHSAGVGRFLRHCDLVKFSGREPTSGQLEVLLDHALQFVEVTIPTPEPAPEPQLAGGAS